ncbi:hypothetical protein P8864_13365 [Priestia flexa]|uniref:hypothetical protein n=1 Tax=Priestia flexa TaxID=86664 RepID=UPI000C24EA84|nr:hypothetical protein [Priestia flexa]MEC0666862.1 hypothetical protein [Priestia flexa]
MMLYDLHNKLYYQVFNSAQPKMTDSHQGRSWGYVKKLVNGKPIKFWLDYTWGRFMYFSYNEKWYRVEYLQANDKKQVSGLFNGALIDLILEGEELNLVRGTYENRRLLL